MYVESSAINYYIEKNRNYQKLCKIKNTYVLLDYCLQYNLYGTLSLYHHPKFTIAQNFAKQYIFGTYLSMKIMAFTVPN